MEEYDHNTGIFRLSAEMARHYHRTADRPVDPPEMTFYAEKFTALGFDVISVSDAELQIKASHDEIWEILSGQHPYL
ncbi:MAG: hypothetical protein L0Y67_04080 [Gammaproteobacteria bacterium]|nr:hypothetical protein [Gammaproteobacteria bacterium]MCI0590772.1 hypothetical protein [Gammaproteobacteria bacterium]